MAQGERTFVGLDIGTTKISCIVADMNGTNGSSGEPRVVGIGNAPSEGLRRGVRHTSGRANGPSAVKASSTI